MSFFNPPSTFYSSPPPPPLIYVPEGTDTDYTSASSPSPHSSSSMNPSILIIILILVITFVASISLCLLLRHLNRRCLRRLSSSTTTLTSAADSHSQVLSNRRVSPENPKNNFVDSLPLFTFSAVTRRNSTEADCAVCLSKFEPNDQLRLLPVCCHAFHAECIDTWLGSNQTCPLCRSSIFVSEADIIKSTVAAAGSGSESFRLEIGNVSRRRTTSDSGEAARRSYSIGSFEYLVDDDSEISMSHAHRRSISDKEETGARRTNPPPPPMETDSSLASEVTGGRSWLKDYIDRLSASVSSRAMSFRSSGRFFSGSSRRSEISGLGDWDLESNRVGEEISEMFRWLSGV